MNTSHLGWLFTSTLIVFTAAFLMLTIVVINRISKWFDAREAKQKSTAAKIPESEVLKAKFLPPRSEEQILLGLLIDSQPHLAADLVEASNGKIKRTRIYVVLAKMEEQGWVRSTTANTEKGLPRRLYQITPRGMENIEA